MAYISTKNSPLSISTFETNTNKQSSIFIEKEGSISINTPKLNIQKMDYDKNIDLIDSKFKQSYYDFISLNNGGYTIVWTEKKH